MAILGSLITVSTTNKDPMCLAVVTPWQLSVPVGRLSPGRYSVLVVHNGRPIGGLEILEVRSAGPDFLIEAMRWTPVSPSVGDPYVNFEVMVVNVGGEPAPLAGVVLELYKVKAGQPVVVGRRTWTSGHLNPKQTLVVTLATFPYSQLTWEGGTFGVRACMDATNVVKETDETNNCIERPIIVQGAAVQLFVTARCITLPTYSLLGVPVAYQVKDPTGTPVEAGTKGTPFTLAYPKGFGLTLDAPDTHDLHRFRHWRVGTPPSFYPDPVSLTFDPAVLRAEAQYTVMPERKCTECFRGTLGSGDSCGNGVGYSVPGPSGGDPRCQAPDCCGWYQVSHVHDLGAKFINVHLVLEYTPGFLDGCQGTLTVEISPDGQSWVSVHTAPTTTVDLAPPHQLWGTYSICVRVPRMTEFRYVRVTITNCYVDYSAVYTCGD
ncbi:MAG: hypothetical protein N2320_00870 [Candidatus Bipolaricaulota bacterium]|nr:hypothetical protein [Candidatus Bipolaricaulota bacterium]